MQNRLTAALVVALSLSACSNNANHGNLNYFQMDPYQVRDLYYSPYRPRGPLQGTQMRRAMETAGVMYGNGCYRPWCR